MAHYFDDIFQRNIDVGVPRSPGMRRIRRSSTARSISARSDFDAPVHDAEEDAVSSANALSPEDPGRAREKAMAESHLHQYISDQLNRYKSRNGDYDNEDEIEAQA